MHYSKSRNCKLCNQSKPLTEFWCWDAEKGYYAWRCNDCDKKRKHASYVRFSNQEHILPDEFTCRRCNITKSITEFWPRKGTKAGHYTTCKTCESEKKLLIQYGLTFEDKQRMYAEQHGKCAICNRKFSIERLMVDHYHSSHRPSSEDVRGLLCNNCNRSIGLLGESIYLYKNAANYLLRHYFKGNPPTIIASVPVGHSICFCEKSKC